MKVIRKEKGKKEPLQVLTQTAVVDVKRIKSCPSLAHLSDEQAEELAAFLSLYCQAVFRIVEKQREGNDSRGTPFDVEQNNKAA